MDHLAEVTPVCSLNIYASNGTRSLGMVNTTVAGKHGRHSQQYTWPILQVLWPLSPQDTRAGPYPRAIPVTNKQKNSP